MYTQNNEEEIILNYFKDRHSSDMCVFDCGSNDGKIFSNSLKVIELGWRGVCIEPSPKAFVSLYFLHKDNERVKCYQLAITKYDGVFELQESGTMLNNGDVALVSSLKPEETERWKGAGVEYSKVNVQGLSFKTFCETNNYNKFNLISIDCEGNDFEVLSQIDLKEVGCEMLIVEWNSKNKEQFVNYVLPFGLKLISENPENLIFAL